MNIKTIEMHKQQIFLSQNIKILSLSFVERKKGRLAHAADTTFQLNAIKKTKAGAPSLLRAASDSLFTSSLLHLSHDSAFRPL